MKESN